MVTLYVAAANLAIAVACGALIGSERQVRQRMAGLRTNALVALGAAAFVTFSQLVPNEVSPTRVAAQVVSGIGFLGAGIIFRDGFNVHGLNTAATLWCSAAVGLVAGIGAWEYALLVTGLVVFVNLGLRPLVKWIKRKTAAGVSITRGYHLEIRTDPVSESGVREHLVLAMGRRGLTLGGIAARDIDGAVELTITLTADGATEGAMEVLIADLATNAAIRLLHWHPVEDV